ncbi:MAG: zinc carboxypeptidase [Methylotenera sp.]|nr:zinc carboxypeptidase [Oligoflexia bacterium]
MKTFQRIAVLSTFIFTVTGFITSPAWSHSIETNMRYIQIAARNKQDRSRISNLGVSIEGVRSDSVWGFASESVLKRVQKSGLRILGNFDFKTGRGGHEGAYDFPMKDERFHNYAETLAALKELQSKNSDIVTLQSIGKTVEKRDIMAMHINTTPRALKDGFSNKPGAIFMGNHHAREHLSLEVPLMLAEYLLAHRADAQIKALLDSRDLWIIPMVNPDGAEWDISTGSYKMWRKNRRDNGDGTFGVDLNRNYGHGWGTGGSDKDTSSDVYMGTSPFSEPETQAIRDFVSAHLNAKVLLSFHTFSELVLYPWGGKNDPVEKIEDRNVFIKMAKTMSGWNKYTPEQASDLYIASGDTTDWAYGEHGIFAFTFELSPTSMWNGGFYPGQKIIDKVFSDNLKPCLYMIDVADDPYKVLKNSPSRFLKNYVEPSDGYQPSFETQLGSLN